MSRFSVSKDPVAGATSFIAGGNLDISLSGEGDIILDKSHLLLPIVATTAGTAGYIDMLLGLFKNRTLYKNGGVLENQMGYGTVMANYLDKLVGREYRNTVGVSKFGMDKRCDDFTMTLVEATPNTETHVWNGTDKIDNVVRKLKWSAGDTFYFPIPLTFLYTVKENVLPCRNVHKWRAVFLLESNLLGLVASSGSPVFQIGQPTFHLHRELNVGKLPEVHMLSIRESTTPVAGSAVFSWNVALSGDYRNGGIIMIQKVDTDQVQTIENQTKFSHNGITGFNILMPSKIRYPASGDYALNEAEASYECYEQLRSVKEVLDEHIRPTYKNDELMQIGSEVNGLVSNSGRDFQIALSPGTVEDGLAVIQTTGTTSAAAQMYLYEFASRKVDFGSGTFAK